MSQRKTKRKKDKHHLGAGVDISAAQIMQLETTVILYTIILRFHA